MKPAKLTIPMALGLGILTAAAPLCGQIEHPGPEYRLPQWVRTGGPPGGIGYDIRMNPEDPDVMYVTDSGAGMFKSTNGGQAWVPANDGLEPSPGAGAPVFCATIDPHDPGVVWCGTQFTAHIYRSTDAGQTWEERDNGIIPAIGEHSVRGIKVHPDSQQVVYVALEEGFDIVNGFTPTGGEVYRSSDSGLNWTRIWRGDSLARYIWIDPVDPARIFVSTGIFDRTPANADSLGQGGGVGVLRSLDRGQTWDILDEGNGLGGRVIPSLFMHPRNPDILVAAITSVQGNPPRRGST